MYTKSGYTGDWGYDVIHAPKGKGEKELLDHAQSLAVFEELIEKFSNPGDTILDPFCVSGTTAVVALKKNRRVIACDISGERIKLTHKRIEDETGIYVEYSKPKKRGCCKTINMVGNSPSLMNVLRLQQKNNNVLY